MNKIKKLISVLMCMAMLCAVLPCVTVGAEEAQQENYKEDELVDTVRTVTDRYTVCHEKSIVKVSFVSQVFAEWLTDDFGEYASGKKMPGWAFGMPFSYRQSLLKGLIDFDGSTVAGKDNCHRIPYYYLASKFVICRTVSMGSVAQQHNQINQTERNLS